MFLFYRSRNKPIVPNAHLFLNALLLLLVLFYSFILLHTLFVFFFLFCCSCVFFIAHTIIISIFFFCFHFILWIDRTKKLGKKFLQFFFCFQFSEINVFVFLLLLLSFFILETQTVGSIKYLNLLPTLLFSIILPPTCHFD